MQHRTHVGRHFRYFQAALAIRDLLLGGVRVYQRWVSPYLPPRCRFYPTCSEYAAICLQQNSLARACLKISLRVAKCNPFHTGGVDIP